ncbi:MAG: hypothetical protein AAFY59_03245 [Pseudomonadota bacterium]
MSEINQKEIDAILRMMVYLKFELLRNSLEEEALLIGQAIDSFQVRFQSDSET